MIYAQSAGTATNAQACLDAAYKANSTAVEFSFDNSTGACTYSTAIYGYYLRVSGEQPSFWLRIDPFMQSTADTTCLTNQDAEYLIMELSYGNQTCVQGLMNNTADLCVATEYNFEYGDYAAGNLQDGTQYLLTRAQAEDSVDYLCDHEEDAKTTVLRYGPHRIYGTECGTAPSQYGFRASIIIF
ncbi:hypothetical protein AAVH_28171 [Aphelenchoides avenae]|nr:hypothetical protein AAVH_28171 [Aphelenchus avenae]